MAFDDTIETWLDEKRREVETIRGIATQAIVPSRRDFCQFIASQRTAVNLVPRLARRDPATETRWPDLDLVALAKDLDDTDIGALAFRSAALHGGSLDELAEVSTAVSAPVLRDDLCLHEAQVYDSRLRGADAILIPAGILDDEEVVRIADIAVSLHMTPVVAVRDRDQLARLEPRAPWCVGIECTMVDGYADLSLVGGISDAVPHHLVVVLLSELRTLDDAAALSGLVDAVVVGKSLFDRADPVAAVESYLAAL